jgi:hypothetical protein
VPAPFPVEPGALLAANLRQYLKRVWLVDTTVGAPKLQMHRRVDTRAFLEAKRAGKLELVRYDDAREREYWRVK